MCLIYNKSPTTISTSQINRKAPPVIFYHITGGRTDTYFRVKSEVKREERGERTDVDCLVSNTNYSFHCGELFHLLKKKLVN